MPTAKDLTVVLIRNNLRSRLIQGRFPCAQGTRIAAFHWQTCLSDTRLSDSFDGWFLVFVFF